MTVIIRWLCLNIMALISFQTVLSTLDITSFLALSLLIDIHIAVMWSRQRHSGSSYSRIRNTVQDTPGTKFTSCVSGLLSSCWELTFVWWHCFCASTVYSVGVHGLSVLSTQTHCQLRLKMLCLQPGKARMGQEDVHPVAFCCFLCYWIRKLNMPLIVSRNYWEENLAATTRLNLSWCWRCRFFCGNAGSMWHTQIFPLFTALCHLCLGTAVKWMNCEGNRAISICTDFSMLVAVTSPMSPFYIGQSTWKYCGRFTNRKLK